MNTLNKINDGGPVYPVALKSPDGHQCGERGELWQHSGMSLRVHCAVTVLPALVSLVTVEDMKKFTPEQCHKRCAQGAVMLADALIAKLEKPA